MMRFWLGVAAMAALSACSGGNPFGVSTDADADAGFIPAEISSDLQGISYDPNNQTLLVRGISLDDTPFEAVYRRRPGMDRGGYEAYTAQDSSLDRHSTAYVRQIGDTRAAIVVTGGQFAHYFGGGVYGRTGQFNPPAGNDPNRVVSYAGNYVGLMNLPGDGGDLLPVAPGTPADIRPVEAGEVTGRILVNADFNDYIVNGEVFSRVYVDNPGLALNNLELSPTAIDPSTGTFDGDVTVATQARGKYGGIFGGADASSVAGALFASDHIDNVTEEDEYGVFVLQKCGTPGDDALCNQPNP